MEFKFAAKDWRVTKFFRLSHTFTFVIYRVSVKSLYNFQKFITKATEETNKWKLLQNETIYI